MGSKGGDAPKAPNPKETSAAQTGTNIGTALANNALGNVNQVTPDGTLKYDQSGDYKYTDPYTGHTYTIPTYTATQTLSEQQQKIKDQNDAASLNLGRLANNQSGFLTDYMSQPIDINNEETEARLMELGRKRLDPVLAERQQSLETQLANKGIKMGSSAYDRAMDLNTQGSNDAYNQLLLSGRGQSVQEQLAERNQPINEITALLSGSQVSQPNFIPTQGGSIPTTDNAGIINSDYSNRLGIWNTQQQGGNALLGGLFQAGGALGSAAISSDIRLKKDVMRVGEVNGLGLYLFRYKDEPETSERRLGFMAQEVREVMPDAVVYRPDGMMAVDYAKVLGAH